MSVLVCDNAIDATMFLVAQVTLVCRPFACLESMRCWVVLDNYNHRILPATLRKDLVPVYSFNGSSLYTAKQRGLGKAVPGGNQKNKKWLELLAKIKKN